MKRATRRILCMAGLLALIGSAARPAPAQPPLGRGTKDVGLAGGLSISHDTKSRIDLESVTGFHLLGRLGLVVTDEAGPGPLRGSLELLLEPTLVHLSGEDHSATVGGAAALVRWIFSGTGRVRPFLEAGAGVLGGQTEFRQITCDVNFVLEVGPGVLAFLTDRVALAAGYRFQHISNGDRCESNLGLNSSLVHLGVSYFFP